jgi:two-component system cell cycle sensor histidine kinase/response regulator CckA
LLGYHVLETTNGRQALKLFKQHTSEIALVLSDMVMPEMGRQALLRPMSQLERGIKVVLMSGHPPEEAAFEELRAEGLTGWLPRPPDLTKLAEAIAQALTVDK